MPPTGLSSEPDRSSIATLLADDAPYLPVRQYLTDATTQIAQARHIHLAPHQRAPYVCVPTGWGTGRRYHYRYVALVENVTAEDVIGGCRTLERLRTKWRIRHPRKEREERGSRDAELADFRSLCDEAFRFLVDERSWTTSEEGGPIHAALSAEPFFERDDAGCAYGGDESDRLKLLTSRAFHDFDGLRRKNFIAFQTDRLVLVSDLYEALVRVDADLAFYHSIERLALTVLGSGSADPTSDLVTLSKRRLANGDPFRSGILGIIRAFGQPRALAVWFAPADPEVAEEVCKRLDVALHAAERLLEQLLLQRVSAEAFPAEKAALGLEDLKRALQQAWTTRAAPRVNWEADCAMVPEPIGTPEGFFRVVRYVDSRDRTIALEVDLGNEPRKPFCCGTFQLHLDPPLADSSALVRAALLLNSALEVGARRHEEAQGHLADKARAKEAAIQAQVRDFQTHAISTQFGFIGLLLDSTSLLRPEQGQIDQGSLELTWGLSLVHDLAQNRPLEDALDALADHPQWFGEGAGPDVVNAIRSSYDLVRTLTSGRLNSYSGVENWLRSDDPGVQAISRLVQDNRRAERYVRAALRQLAGAQSQNEAVLRIGDTPPLRFTWEAPHDGEDFAAVVAESVVGALSVFLRRAAPLLLDRKPEPLYRRQADLLFDDVEGSSEQWLDSVLSRASFPYEALSEWVSAATGKRIRLKPIKTTVFCSGSSERLEGQSIHLFRAFLQEAMLNALKYCHVQDGSEAIRLTVAQDDRTPEPKRFRLSSAFQATGFQGHEGFDGRGHYGLPFIERAGRQLFPSSLWDFGGGPGSASGRWTLWFDRNPPSSADGES